MKLDDFHNNVWNKYIKRFDFCYLQQFINDILQNLLYRMRNITDIVYDALCNHIVHHMIDAL